MTKKKRKRNKTMFGSRERDLQVILFVVFLFLFIVLVDSVTIHKLARDRIEEPVIKVSEVKDIKFDVVAEFLAENKINHNGLIIKHKELMIKHKGLIKRLKNHECSLHYGGKKCP